MLYFMFNKPQGCVTAVRDKSEHTVMEYFPPDLARKLHPVGRLDKDTSGLLIFTDDGTLDLKIMQPEKHVSKTYIFHAFGNITDEKIAALERGVQLDTFTTKPAKFGLIRRCTVSDLEPIMPADKREHYMKNPDGPAFIGTLTICEGKKHQVKRMLEAVHCKVLHLHRESIGGLVLDSRLSAGDYRPLTDEELRLLLEK